MSTQPVTPRGGQQQSDLDGEDEEEEVERAREVSVEVANEMQLRLVGQALDRSLKSQQSTYPKSLVTMEYA